MVRPALTAEQIALMAAGGANLAASTAVATPGVVAPAVAVAAVAAAEGTGVAAPAAAAAAAEPAEAAAPVPAPATAVVASAATASTDVTAFLQGQIATKDAALLSANVENAGLKAKIADSEASINGLKAIAAASVSNMRVALGGAKTDLSALTATELLAQHSAAKTEFEKKFVVGGIAAVDAAQAPKAGNDPSVTPAEAERLNRFLA